MCFRYDIFRTCKLCYKQTPFKGYKVQCKEYAAMTAEQQASHPAPVDYTASVFEVFEGGPHGIVHCDWCQTTLDTCLISERPRVARKTPKKFGKCVEFNVKVKCPGCPPETTREVTHYRYCKAHAAWAEQGDGRETAEGKLSTETGDGREVAGADNGCAGDFWYVEMETELEQCGMCEFRELYVDARKEHCARWHKDTLAKDPEATVLLVQNMDRTSPEVLWR